MNWVRAQPASPCADSKAALPGMFASGMNSGAARPVPVRSRQNPGSALVSGLTSPDTRRIHGTITQGARMEVPPDF